MKARLLATATLMLLLLQSCSGSDSRGSASPEQTAASNTPGAATTQPVNPFAAAWPRTDFSRRTIDLDEVIQGCPGRDCIPALDAEAATSVPSTSGGQANFVPVSTVSHPAQLPVAYVSVGGIVRGYPLHILTWHEIVNDRFGDVPVVVTFCPLCNTALAFDRRVGDQVLDFGVSGNLRNSDLIMWDRQTESWWQQATGEAIVGTLAGTVLKPVSAPVISFEDFARGFPSAEVLTEDTGFVREYGVNPYAGYDARGTTPFLFSGKVDARLDALERVVSLGADGAYLAVPFGALSQAGIANLTVADQAIVVFWAPGTVSALDRSVIAESRDVGAAIAYVAGAQEKQLTFTQVAPGSFRDDQTGSTWDVTGLATAGPLAGERLAVAEHSVQFWFSWAAFHPDTTIWEP